MSTITGSVRVIAAGGLASLAVAGALSPAASVARQAATSEPTTTTSTSSAPGAGTTGTSRLVRYEVTDLGTLGGELANAFGINDRGEVTGVSETVAGFEAFVWEDGEMVGLGGVGGASSGSSGYEVGTSGQVVGYAMAIDPEFGGRTAVPFHWDASDGMEKITHDFTYSGSGIARDVNAGGDVVGSWRSKAFTWTAEQGYHELEPLSTAFPVGEALAVNDRAVAVGEARDADAFLRAVRWTAGAVAELPGLPRGQYARANDVNNVGIVAGEAEKVEDSGLLVKPVLWNSDGKIEEIPTLPAEPPLDMGYAEGVADDGTIIGWDFSSAAGDGRQVGWIRHPDGTKEALDPQVDPYAGWSITVPLDVNEHGQIVGIGIHEVDGETYYGRAFLMTPVELAAAVSIRYQREVAYADLVWERTGARKVEVRRDGEVIATTRDDGAWSHRIGKVPAGTEVTYQVCVAGAEQCSAVLTAVTATRPAALDRPVRPVTFLVDR